jgi:hypothetical protein
MDDVEKEFKGHFDYDKGKGKRDKEPPKRPIRIKKYTAKGTIPLHEAVVINKVPKFVYLDKDKKPHFVDSIERTNDILIPGDTFDTQNPLPFIFESEKHFEECLEQANGKTLDTLFEEVELINRKYVDTEDHYHVLLTADMIWTWVQDKFGYTHYDIIRGDNGSGKNSQLLVFKFLGYRVFYVVSATAPNYFTKMGNVEEGQVTIAEDEAEDIAIDKEKRTIIKNGYASGGSVPKVELEGGRRSDDWLVYSHKWFAMEELPAVKEIKGILDRSFVLTYVAGDPKYNIKDIINSAGEPKFKPLYDELINIRNILFCWRLINYYEPILDVKLNVKNRSAELTKPLIRLFQNSPVALGKILYSLSQFMTERNENKATSFESITYKVIEGLIKERETELAKENPIPDLVVLGETTFTNESMRNMCKQEMDGNDIIDKPGAFWSPIEGVGTVSQTRITSTCKSRFKGKTKQIRLSEGNTRCIIFDKKALEGVKSNYEIVNKIKIEPQEPVTLVTDVTLYSEDSNTKKEIFNENDEGDNTKIDNNSGKKEVYNLLQSVTSDTSVTKENESVTNIEEGL